MTLAEILRRHGSDKAEHGYAEVYEADLGGKGPISLLEVGVFRGDSIAAWLEFVPARGGVAQITGLDVFDRVALWDVHARFRREPRVWLVQGDSRATQIRGVDGFDVIIDDGSHNPADQLATWRNLWPAVKPGGVYYVEDVFLDMAHPWAASRGWNPHELLAQGFEVFDFRAASGRPDSVLLRMRKPL